MSLRSVLAVAGLGPRALDALPELPPRPHGFDRLERLDLDLRPEGQPPMRVHVRATGEGPPLVLVHGMMTSAYSFRYVAERLGETYRVYVPDLPGAGRTVAPAETDMSPRGIGRVLIALFDALGLEHPYVVANSLGGYLAVWLALEHPDRVGRLLVMHAPGFPDARMHVLRVATKLPGARAILRIVTRDAEGFATRNVHYHDESVKSREEAMEYGRIFRDPTQTELFFKVLRDTLDPRHMSEMHRRLTTWPARVPVGLLWARHDVMVPPWTGERYAAALPAAPITWMDGVSHFMHVDDPERTAAHILAFGEPR